jgi:hypothetical protein
MRPGIGLAGPANEYAEVDVEFVALAGRPDLGRLFVRPLKPGADRAAGIGS